MYVCIIHIYIYTYMYLLYACLHHSFSDHSQSPSRSGLHLAANNNNNNDNNEMIIYI